MADYNSIHTGKVIDDAIQRIVSTPGSGAIKAADVEAAPSGYGFGEKVQHFIYNDDNDGSKFVAGMQPFIDSLQPSTTYLCDIQNYPFLPAVSFRGFIWRTGTRVCIRAWTYNGEEISRIYDDLTGWFPWEWVNPTMVIGVEYRTTEKYKGKPVYTKLCGPVSGLVSSSPLDLVVYYNTPNIDNVIDCRLMQSANGITGYFQYIPFRNSENFRIDITGGDSTYVRCRFVGSSFGAVSLIAKIKYTKTTD